MNPMIEHQIKLIGDLRQRAIESIIETVSKLKAGVTTEQDALNSLIESLHSRGIGDYWYPAGEESGAQQFGCIVVFDTSRYNNRTSFPNARTLTVSKNIRWEGIGYFYVSPQQISDRGEVLWGDIGSSVYTGDSQVIRSYFRKCWEMSECILHDLDNFKHLTTNKVYQIYDKYSKTFGVKNIAVSKSGLKPGTSGENIGHSFPIGATANQSQDLANVKISLAKKRKFIDGQSEYSLNDEIWSLEPRDHPDGYPYGAISFHRLFAQSEEKKILFPDCTKIFKTVGMHWILDI
jgi:hypothetical protein